MLSVDWFRVSIFIHLCAIEKKYSRLKRSWKITSLAYVVSQHRWSLVTDSTALNWDLLAGIYGPSKQVFSNVVVYQYRFHCTYTLPVFAFLLEVLAGSSVVIRSGCSLRQVRISVATLSVCSRRVQYTMIERRQENRSPCNKVSKAWSNEITD